MMKIEVGDGWASIVLNLIVIGSGYPDSWNFKFRRAWRNSGRMRIHVTTDTDDMEALKATVALSGIAWGRSGIMCEVCGRGAHLRLGQRYSLTLCEEHGHLIGEPHPDDGKIRELGRDQQHWLPPGYDGPDGMKDALLRMWASGNASTYDVTRILRMSRSDIMSEAYGSGLQLHDNDEVCGTEIARLFVEAKDDGTRH